MQYNETDLANAFDSGYEAAAEDIHELIIGWEGELTPPLLIKAIEDLLGWQGYDDDVDLNDFDLDDTPDYYEALEYGY